MLSVRKLPLGNYDYLKEYFGRGGWEHPSFYYSPMTAIVYILGCSPPHREIRIAEDGTPIFCIGDSELSFKIVAPRDPDYTRFLTGSLLSISRAKVKLYAPNFTPDRSVYEVYWNDPQVIYNTETIVQNYPAALDKKDRYEYRRNDKDTVIRQVGPDSEEDIVHVLEAWRAGPAATKKTQVTYKRDFLAIPYTNSGLSFISWRDGLPVSWSFVDPIPSFPGYASQVIAKGLNYKDNPGGRTGTSKWEFIQCCRLCLAAGIRFLNGGGYEPRVATLMNYKHQFAKKEEEVKDVHWRTIEGPPEREEQIPTVQTLELF